MRKSRKTPDLNISREVTDRIRQTLKDLLNEEIRCADYAVDRFALSYMLKEFESKYVDENTDPPEIRRERAIKKWLGVEERNRKTNLRVTAYTPTIFWSERENAQRGFPTQVGPHEILAVAASLIEVVIGYAPPDDIFLTGGFTGGATTSRKKRTETLASKFQGKLDATPSCYEVVKPAIEDAMAWTLYTPEVLEPRLVKGNIMFTVPKSAVIDRVCCKEPDLNIFFQKAAGNEIRKCLKSRAGINLNDQSINRGLAEKGSHTGKLATIDLSSASDSLSRELVRRLVPPAWYKLLDSLRCRKTFIEGRSRLNEMFSSMGNGFTFELESLVFWALARATQVLSGFNTEELSVFGDDIIVPTTIASRVITVLTWCGFTPNAKKTFVRGPFRESCGGHYYWGLDVTPFYLRRPLKDVSDLILFLNQYRAWIIRVGADQLSDGWDKPNNFVKFWYDLSAYVPKSVRGGWDTSSRTQLASIDRPKCELLRGTRKLAGLSLRYSLGQYLSRLCELDKRKSDPQSEESGDPFVVPTTEWLIRRTKYRASDFGLFCPLFTCEQ